MMIVKSEKIYLSEEEQEIFTKFVKILEVIEEESEDLYIKVAIDKIKEGIFDLGNYLEEY